MSDLPCTCRLTTADNCRCEAGDIAYTSDLQDEVATLRSDLADCKTECALWLDRSSRHRARAERAEAMLKEAVEALRKAEFALVDLGACDDPRCCEECCVGALVSVRATLARIAQEGKG